MRDLQMAESGHELEKDSLGLSESVIMGIAGTAPAFSIAATTGTLIAAAGMQSIASLFYCGLIMFGITLSYLHLNRINTNAGAAYAWVGEVFHPVLGFFAGWSLLVASTVFMVSGTIPAATATLALISPAHANSPGSVTLVAAFWLLLVGFILVRGVKLTSYAQVITTVVEMAILLLIFFAAFITFAPTPVAQFTWHDFSLTAFTPQSFSAGALTSLFFFWGWDVTLNLSEETEKSDRNPGRGAIIAMIIMLLVFIGFTLVVQLGLTEQEIQEAGTNVILAVANKIFPEPWGYMAVLAVMLSTIGTLETTIVQFTRTMFAKGRDGVLHPRYALIHKKWKTPWVATALVTGIGLILLFLSSFYPSVNDIIDDSVKAIAFQVAFYYSLTGFACAWRFRKQAYQRWQDLITIFLWPIFSSCFLVFIGLYSLVSFDTNTSIIGVCGILLGIVPLMLNRRAKR